MASPVIRVNSQSSGGGSSLTVTLPSNNAGHTLIAACFSDGNYPTSLSDSAGNTWTNQGGSTNGGRFGVFYTALNCLASASTNTLSVGFTNVQDFAVTFLEYGAYASVRLASTANASGSTNPSISLSGTVAGDLVVAQVIGSGTAVSTGNISGSAANLASSTGFSDVLIEDGFSTGGTITATGIGASAFWTMEALVLVAPGTLYDRIVVDGMQSVSF